MLKFFKIIRQQLITKGNFKKYLIYAIGEIILVVAGILIALSINNWNERRKTEILELEYLKRLRTDLKVDSLYLNNEMQECKKAMKGSYQYIHKAYETQNSIEDYVDLVEFLIHRTENLVVQNSTYTELNNAGLLSIIQNKVLKDSLIALYREYEYVASRIKEFNDYHSRFLSSIKVYGRKYAKDRSRIFDQNHMFNETEWKFINDPTSQDFKDQEWAQAMYYVKNAEALELHKKLIIRVKFLIGQIDRELEQRI
ncbi:MAG: hypothetical protein KJN85_16640 [Maribacter sp.]|nr:hypothetical protein [Maribacter sp.]